MQSRPLLAPGCAMGRFQSTFKVSKHRASLGEQRAASFGQLDAAGLAVKQLHVKLLFDRLDLLAQRRLLHAELFSGSRYVPRLGDRNEESIL
jgi:hypothetical protein